MPLFNTTFTVDIELRNGWLRWMKEIYVPQMQAAAPAARHALYHIDGSIRDGALSFSSQWLCPDIRSLGAVRLQNKRLCDDLAQTHGDKCLAFSTMMKEQEL